MSTDLDDLTPDDLRDLDDLRALMTRSLAYAEPPVRRLTDRAEHDGRRLRRRRKAAVAVGGIAAAAAVTALAVPLTGGSGSTAEDDGYAGPPSRAADAGKPFVAQPGFWDMPAQQMAQRLTGLLPRRVSLVSYETTSSDHAPGESDAQIGYLTGTLAGTTGPGSVNVMLTQMSDQAADEAAASGGTRWGDQDLGCPPELGSAGVVVQTCTTRSDTSDRVVQRELETLQDGVTYREVRIVTGGGMIYVATANSTQRKWEAPASATRNPLTLSQLARIAASSDWTDWTSSGS
jgi:hypothetical protein